MKAATKQAQWDCACLEYTSWCWHVLTKSLWCVSGTFPSGGFSSTTGPSTSRTAPSASSRRWTGGTRARSPSASTTPGRAAPTTMSLPSASRMSPWVTLPKGGWISPRSLCLGNGVGGQKKGENVRSRRWSSPEVSQWKERGDVMGGITRKLETSLSGLQQNRCRYQLKIKKNIPTLKWKKFHFYSTQKLKNRPLPLFSTVV